MKEVNLNNYARLIGGVFIGMIGGGLLSVNIDAGALKYFRELDSIQNLFGNESQPIGYEIVWGGRWFIRGLTSILCTAWGAFLAGIFARSKGNIIGLISAVPTSIIWLIFLSIAVSGGFTYNDVDIQVYSTFMTNIMAAALVVGSVYVAYLAGDEGHVVGSMYKTHFENRKYSLFGIKWFHFLWMPLIVYMYIYMNAYTIARIYPLVSYSMEYYSAVSLIYLVILAPYYYSFYITYTGLFKAFLILSDIDQISKLKDKIILVLKYGFVFPIIGIIIQSAMIIILMYIANFFR